MGILFVLAFWIIVGAISTVIGTLIARHFATYLLRAVKEDSLQLIRARLVRNAMIFPSACLVWAGLVFVFQAVINSTYLQRDIGLGDEMYCPLPNGYSLLMIDVGDDGEIMRGPDASESSQEGAVSGVRELQVAGSNIFGGRDSQSFQHFGQDNPSVDRYFALDTRTGRQTEFDTQDALRVSAFQLGVTLKLEPIFNVYRRYRFTWFDAMVVALLLVPPAIVAGLILRSIIRIRRIAPAQTASKT